MEGGPAAEGGNSAPQVWKEQEEDPVAFGEPGYSTPGETRQHQQYPVATFEERFQQFYLQLADGKTGGMVVSNSVSILFVEASDMH